MRPNSVAPALPAPGEKPRGAQMLCVKQASSNSPSSPSLNHESYWNSFLIHVFITFSYLGTEHGPRYTGNPHPHPPEAPVWLGSCFWLCHLELPWILWCTAVQTFFPFAHTHMNSFTHSLPLWNGTLSLRTKRRSRPLAINKHPLKVIGSQD